MTIYDRIKALREDNDITQAAISKSINVSQRAYSYYETGQRMIPPEVIVSIAEFFNVSTDYLLGRTDKLNPYPQKRKMSCCKIYK